MKLRDLAQALRCDLVGDGDREITGVAGIEHAGPSELTFLANRKYASKVRHTRAAAILSREPMVGGDLATLVSRDPYLDFARAVALFYQPPRPARGIHPTAVIAPTATIGEDASIGPYAVVGDHVTIGARAVMHAHVVVYAGVRIGDDFLAHAHSIVREHCRLGHRVTLQNGVVVGADGFGFAKRADQSHEKIAQSGVTVIEDDVEIQSLSAIDRATVGETRVRRGAKIDNLVQVGHACEVGEDALICAQVGLAGSTVVGRNALLAGQVGVAGHCTVGDNAVAYAQSGIPNDVAAGTVVAGSPSMDYREWRRLSAVLPKLPDLLRTVRQLERQVQALHHALGQAPPSDPPLDPHE